ncbi:hypothetical protein V6N11_017253 [Hibiscus sabdariffa]|uniref:Uncharacterized protein n=1 Tax=Hibiscus sabdariffa TaxID=183260 RepID=A0ABR2TXZ9_9ROSI
MSTDSLLNQFDNLIFTTEEQDVYASPNFVMVLTDDPRLSMKQEIHAPPKVRIRLHAEGGSSNPQSDFYTIGDDIVFGGASDPIGKPSAHATFVDVAPLYAIPDQLWFHLCLSLQKLLHAWMKGRVHVAESVLLGNEHDVFSLGVSNVAAATMKGSSGFDAIEEWLIENDDPDAPVQDEPPVKIHVKRSSSGLDLSKVKRARFTITSSLPKVLRVSKAGMSS